MMALLVLTAGAGVVSWAVAPLWPDIHPAITAALAALALWLLHRLLLYAESRGHIYYLKARGSYGGLGVTTNFLNMYDPGRKHLQETTREREWKREEDDDADGPKNR
jgi:hypothetical protein